MNVWTNSDIHCTGWLVSVEPLKYGDALFHLQTPFTVGGNQFRWIVSRLNWSMVLVATVQFTTLILQVNFFKNRTFKFQTCPFSSPWLSGGSLYSTGVLFMSTWTSLEHGSLIFKESTLHWEACWRIKYASFKVCYVNYQLC